MRFLFHILLSESSFFFFFLCSLLPFPPLPPTGLCSIIFLQEHFRLTAQLINMESKWKCYRSTFDIHINNGGVHQN